MRKWKVVLAIVLVLALAGCLRYVITPKTDSLLQPGRRVKSPAFESEAAREHARIQGLVDAANREGDVFQTKYTLGRADLDSQTEQLARIDAAILEFGLGAADLATSGKATPWNLAGLALQGVLGTVAAGAAVKRKKNQNEMAVIVNALEPKRKRYPEFAEELSRRISEECKLRGIPKNRVKALTDALKVIKPLTT